ncbi:uncharacterized protein FSUBG_10524 [Fusarium subglutinans]|uniref:Uncharacterized protein n=1 Tax=Gibberella subglutinans TaxID=42677 RepID=A0A8H5P708_GIBSU|nr:uncharacterized protein FSUBG_10524 [Fusarium subglutinans]KAF5591223.1 hypothetical protein FSUBG_10524 [Fusarium subglutinans]
MANVLSDFVPMPPSEHTGKTLIWLIILVVSRGYMNANNIVYGHRSGIIPVLIHAFEFPRAWDSQWWQCPPNGLDVDNQALGYGSTARTSIQARLWCRYHHGLARPIRWCLQSVGLGPVPTVDDGQIQPPTPRRYTPYRRLEDPKMPLAESELLAASSDDETTISEPQLLVIYGPNAIAIPMTGRGCGHRSCTEDAVCNEILHSLDRKHMWTMCNNLVYTNALVYGMSLALDWGCATIIAVAVWTARSSFDIQQHQLIRRFSLYVREVEQAARQLRRSYFDDVNYGYSRPIDILILNGKSWTWCRAETVPSRGNTWLKLSLPTKNFVFAVSDVVIELWTLTVHTILPWHWVGLMVNLAYAAVVGSADAYGWKGMSSAFLAVLAIKCILYGFAPAGHVLYKWISGGTWVLAWYLILFKAMTNVSVQFLVHALMSWLFPDAEVESVVDNVVGVLNVTTEARIDKDLPRNKFGPVRSRFQRSLDNRVALP